MLTDRFHGLALDAKTSLEVVETRVSMAIKHAKSLVESLRCNTPAPLISGTFARDPVSRIMKPTHLASQRHSPSCLAGLVLGSLEELHVSFQMRCCCWILLKRFPLLLSLHHYDVLI